MDIFLIFIQLKDERVFSRNLVSVLAACDGRPWAELRRGPPVTETWLAKQLGAYGVRPRTIRIGEQTAKGYVREELMETFRRYIPKSELEAVKADLADPDAA